MLIRIMINKNLISDLYQELYQIYFMKKKNQFVMTKVAYM